MQPDKSCLVRVRGAPGFEGRAIGEVKVLDEITAKFRGNRFQCCDIKRFDLVRGQRCDRMLVADEHLRVERYGVGVRAHQGVATLAGDLSDFRQAPPQCPARIVGDFPEHFA